MTSPSSIYNTSLPSHSSYTNGYRRTRAAAFSVIELVVTISVFVIVSTVLLANYGSFSSRSILDNLAHEIALTIREAQIYGISVQEFGSGSGIFPSYGINFRSVTPTSFVLYADTNDDDLYTVGEQIEVFTVAKGNTIGTICGYVTTASPCTPLTSLDITFTRPEPDALFTSSPAGPFAYTEVVLLSPRNQTRSVVIWANGQISLQ